MSKQTTKRCLHIRTGRTYEDSRFTKGDETMHCTTEIEYCLDCGEHLSEKEECFTSDDRRY